MNSQFIEVGIGLIFIFLLMAVMVSAVNEMLMSVFAKRGKFMKESLRDALNDPQNKDWSHLLYDHPLIDKLKRSEKRPPAYISAHTFAMALMEVIANEGREDYFEVNGDTTTYIDKTADLPAYDRFRKGLATLNESHFKNVLQSFVNDSNGDYLKLKANIESWFNEYMDRVGGWYKRKMRKSILVISFGITVVMNVDTIDLSIRLWDNAVLRQTLVHTAEAYVDQNPPVQDSASIAAADSVLMKRMQTDTAMTTVEMGAVIDSVQAGFEEPGLEARISEIKSTYDEVGMLNLPIGWEAEKELVRTALLENKLRIAAIDVYYASEPLNRWWAKTGQKISFWYEIICIYLGSVSVLKLLGWFFTAMAVSYGAPFWFDLLNKLINLRGNGKATK